MSALIVRYLQQPLQSNLIARERADVIVFVSTTCLCAFGALCLPLVG